MSKADISGVDICTQCSHCRDSYVTPEVTRFYCDASEDRTLFQGTEREYHEWGGAIPSWCPLADFEEEEDDV